MDLCIRNSQESPCRSMSDHVPTASESKSSPVLCSRSQPMTEEMETVLLDLVKDKMLEFSLNKPIFRPQSWQAIASEFNDTFETSYAFAQLRTKLNNMKKEWRIWNRIKTQTGVGWDSQNQVFTCLDWDVLEQHVKGAKHFAEKRLIHFEVLNELFMGSGATGKRGTTPRSTFSEHGGDFVNLTADEDIEAGADDNLTPSVAKRSLKHKTGEGPSTCQQPGSKASKRSTTEATTFSGGSMDRSNAVHNVRMEKSSYDPTADAVKLLEQMNLDDAMFIKHFQWLLESRSNAAGFLNLSEQHRRVWIEQLQRK